jgi:hypothetical protein
MAHAETLEGGCLCGAVRYRTDGAPYHITHCHCTICRRAAGAAFVSWFSVPAASFLFVRGAPARFASSDKALRQFCAACGTQLTFRFHATPGEIDVTLCSLDDPDRLAPEDHIYTSTRLRCMIFADGLPQSGGKRGESEVRRE